MLKLLIADTGEEFRLVLAESLQGAYITQVTWEGEQTLETMRRFQPDIMVLDLTMPGLDGITLLQRAAGEGLCPMVLATTRFYNDYVLDAAAKLGVGYVMVKPCNIEATILRLADLSERIKPPAVTQPDFRTIVTNLFLSLGIPAKLKGFACLREAVLEAMRDPGQPVTKELYPTVARLCDGNAVQVEHLIRSAILAGWKRRDERIWRMYFQPNGEGQLERPTNAAFISTIASRLSAGQRQSSVSDMSICERRCTK